MATERLLNIFVEGYDDHDLLIALLEQMQLATLDPFTGAGRKRATTTYLTLTSGAGRVMVSATQGWTQIVKSGSPLPEMLRAAAPEDGRNLLIFDADTVADHEHGGPTARREELQRLVGALPVTPSIFLFPDDTQEGNLETLLLRLAHTDHAAITACLDQYDSCLLAHREVGTQEPLYYAPAPKRRVFAYVNALPLSPAERKRHEDQGGQKIFENPRWWDLTHPAIQPLRDFLDQHIH